MLIERIKNFLGGNPTRKEEGEKKFDPYAREVEELKMGIQQEMLSQGIDPEKNPEELRERVNNVLNSWLR